MLPRFFYGVLFSLLTVCFGRTVTTLAPGGGSTTTEVFNVLDFGAKPDDSTDNTAAFAACMAAVVNASGGQMYIPGGVYRGRITVPLITDIWTTVEIVGDGEPTPVWGTVGSGYSDGSRYATTVKSNASSGASVISAQAGARGGFSFVYVVVRNIHVQTYDNPAIGGIDLLAAQQCKLENVVVNTGVYDVQASQPTHGTSGVTTPARGNGAWNVLRNVVVTGFDTGVVCNEHTDADALAVAANINGLSFPAADHASRFARVCAARNTIHVTVLGQHGFTIEQLDIENPGPGQTTPANAWQTNFCAVNDPNNHGIADITYWVVEGNVGPVTNFTLVGGATVRTRRIGSL
jgi:hypothetical protein